MNLEELTDDQLQALQASFEAKLEFVKSARRHNAAVADLADNRSKTKDEQALVAEAVEAIAVIEATPKG